MANRTESNLGINAVRACAAILVVMGHLRAGFFLDYNELKSPNVFTQVFYAVTGVGHQAVLVFFVLSGYWVGGGVLRSTAAGRFTVRNYAVARLARLWVVLLPALLLTALLDRLGQSYFAGSDVYSGPSEYHSVFPSDLAGVSDLHDLIGNILFVQSIHVPTFGTNTPLWSLAYEFWYYAIFPAFVVAWTRRGWARWGAIALGLLFCAVAGTDVLTLFPVWLSGVALAAARSDNWRLSRRVRRTCAGVAVPVLMASMVGASLAPAQALGTVVVTVCTLILVSLLAVDEPLGESGVVRILNWLAERSFTLYAVHNPLVALITAALVPVAINRFTPSVEAVVVFFSALVAIGTVAVVLAQFTEMRTVPVRRWVAVKLGQESGGRAASK